MYTKHAHDQNGLKSFLATLHEIESINVWKEILI